MLILALLLPASAAVGATCVEGDQSVRYRLATKYGERPVARVVTEQGLMVMLYADDSDGSWTLLVYHPDGLVCGLASGDDGYQKIRPKPGDTDG